MYRRRTAGGRCRPALPSSPSLVAAMNGPVHVGPIAAVASRLALGLLLCLSMFATSAQARRLALVIGNDSYQQVSKLDKAVNDAEGMAVELTRAGFEVNKHRDLTFRKTVLAFEEFYDKVKGGDEVVVFYAGHGVQTERGSYLLPTDIEGETISQIEKISYSVNNLLEELDRIKARFSLIIVDACRDNPLRSRGRTIGVARGLNAPDVAKGQMVIFSAGRGQKALDSLNDRDRHPNGVFTRELIARMQTPGLSVEKLAVEVKGAVEKLAATVNHDQRPLIVNDSTGEFFFYPPAGSRPGDASRTTASQAPLSEAAREDRFWEDAKAPDNAEGYEAYLSQYANGRYAGLARANLSRLSARSGADPGSQATTRNSAAPAVSAAPGAGVPAPQSSRPSQAANPGTGPATSPEPPVVLAAARPRPEPTPVPAPSPAAAPQPASSPVPAAGGKPGRASYTLANGDRYEGEVVGNVRSGQGVYQFANGDRYQGTFVDGVSNGRGVMSFANGDRYEGGFIGTTKQGAGVMEFANKDRYEGEFADNLYHGKGSFTFATGERYTGDYVRGLKQGRGVYVFASGDKYEGPFDNDVSHGKGSTTFANGDHFEGEFVKGIKQGPGIFRFANGDRYEGRFVDGLFNGKGRLSLASGDVYEGEFRNNVKDGVGTHLFASKDRYEGQFRDGAQSGTGTHFFANGDRYVGEFANGLRHGKGVYRFASGQTREMDYVQGVEKAP